MKESYRSKLLINQKPAELNPFVDEFLARVSVGIAASLKGVDYIRSLEIHHEHDDVIITVNGEDISLTPFPVQIISNTLRGLVSALKGGDDIKSIHVSVNST